VSKSRPRSEHFARLTQSLLESEAVATLHPTTFKVLALLAIGARPPGLDPRKDKGSNGVQALTANYAKRFGMHSRDTVYRGLQELLERGLIFRTRDGHKSKSHFALFAVAWLPITHWDGQPLDTPRPANDSWREWKPATPRVKKKMPERKPKTVHLQSDSRTQPCPLVGNDQTICRPTMSTRLPLSRPLVGTTLRLLGTTATPPNVAANGADTAKSPSGPGSKVRAAKKAKNGNYQRPEKSAGRSQAAETAVEPPQ